MHAAVHAATVGMFLLENEWDGADVACVRTEKQFVRVVPIDDTDGVKVMEMMTGSEVVISIAEFDAGCTAELIHQYVRGVVLRRR